MVQKPLVYTTIFVCPFFIVSMIVNLMVSKNNENPDRNKEFLAFFGIITMSLLMGGMIMMYYLPRYSTTIILVSRFFLGIIICYLNFVRFHRKIACNDEPTAVEIKYFKIKTNLNVRVAIVTFYIFTSTVLVPFCEKFFLVFTTTSIHFTLEFWQINAYMPF